MTAEVTKQPALLYVSIYTSKVVHLVDTEQLRTPEMHEDRLPSLCKVKPVWPGVWYPPKDNAPICGNCLSVLGAMENE